MISIQDADRQSWDDGTSFYHNLLVKYNCSPSDLAVALGIKCADNVISVRHCQDEYWRVEDAPMLQWAREAYDAGVIEMFQGRVNDHFFQYAVTRKIVRVSRIYFGLNGNGVN